MTFRASAKMLLPGSWLGQWHPFDSMIARVGLGPRCGDEFPTQTERLRTNRRHRDRQNEAGSLQHGFAGEGDASIALKRPKWAVTSEQSNSIAAV